MDRQTRTDLHRLAESQRGLFSAAQAARLGISYSSLSRFVHQHHMRRVRRGVYALPGRNPSRWEEMIAAALIGGPESVISHSTAASAHGLFCAAPVPSGVELTVPRSFSGRLAGVRLHRRDFPGPEDLETRYGVQLTTATRTLVDMAPRLERRLLERTLDEGMLQRLWTADDIMACVSRAPANLAHRRELRRLLGLRAEEPEADTHLELRAFRAMAPLGPFETHYLVTVAGLTYVLDAAWPEQRVGVEVDGRAHRVVSRGAFDRERRKLNALAAARWRVAHLTAAMSDDEMVEAVRSLLLTVKLPDAG
jgi:very-short-patch-repair endonuclease